MTQSYNLTFERFVFTAAHSQCAIDDVKTISCTTSNQWRDKQKLGEYFRKTFTFFVGQPFCNKYCECNAIVFMTTLLTSKFQSWQRWKTQKTKQTETMTEQEKNTATQSPCKPIVERNFNRVRVPWGPKTMLKCHRCVSSTSFDRS